MVRHDSEWHYHQGIPDHGEVHVATTLIHIGVEYPIPQLLELNGSKEYQRNEQEDEEVYLSWPST